MGLPKIDLGGGDQGVVARADDDEVVVHLEVDEVSRAVRELVSLVDISHGRLYVFVTGVRLDLLKRCATFYGEGAPRMAKSVGSHLVADTGRFAQPADDLVDRRTGKSLTSISIRHRPPDGP